MRVCLLFLCLSISCLSENWPQWRGPRLNGTSAEKNLPVKWSPTENIDWSLPLPSVSGATPIIWGERIFLNIADGDQLQLWCVDRNGGKIMWKRPIGGGNVKYRKGNSSSPSPVTDGTNVYVLTGTGMLKGFDFDGKELWARDIQKEYGRFGLNHGYASSPLLLDDAVIVQVLHGMHTDDPSYILRLDKRTGKTVWRVERPTEAIRESPDSYTTPTVMRLKGNPEIIVTGADVMTGHDFATGKELWRAKGFNPGNDPFYRTIASPAIQDDMVFAPTRVRPMMAYRGGGRGDVTDSHRLWSFQNGPDVPSPLPDGQYLYVVQDRGIAWCLEAKTGKEVWGPQRLRTGTYSTSPVLADGKIYVTSEDGVTSVFRAGPKFDLLAENDMADYTLSSIAVSGGQLFLRTTQKLYCIGKRVGK